MDLEIFSYLLWFITLFSGLIILALALIKQRGRYDKIHLINQAIYQAGYAYDSSQDIFYSRKNAWQKDFGYNPLYDEATPSLSMILDCEPIKFNYDNKKWMIELWKGQYGMTTGCEIGIYTADNASITHLAENFVYDCAKEEDQLFVAVILRKNNRILFIREEKHWWLTGFVLGEFSNPEELQMEAGITFKDTLMRDAFINSLQSMGYNNSHIRVLHTTVWLLFRTPFSSQPMTRTPFTDNLIQKKNHMLCTHYQELTRDYKNSLDKLYFLWDKSPVLFSQLLTMGKPPKLFSK